MTDNLIPPQKPRGFHLTPRQSFLLLAGVLATMLVGLIVYLLMFLSPAGFTRSGGDVKNGIKPLLTINGPGRGEKPDFDRPLGVAFGSGGRIYVVDTGNNRVCVFSKGGRFLFEFGGFGVAKPLPGAKETWTEGSMNFPIGIDVDSDGDVYVANFRNDQIDVYDEDGKWLRRFPDPKLSVGRGASGQDGLGVACTDVAVRGDEVYVTDTYQVIVFKRDGTFLRQFGMPGSGPTGLDHPNGIDVGSDGTVYVSDSNHNRVMAFEKNGKPMWQLGEQVSDTTTETTDYDFGLPRGLTVLDSGAIVVVDAFEFALATVSSEGKLLGRYGTRGVEPGQFNFPNGIDDLGKRLAVADKENNRVAILEIRD
ncbi:MAG: hypothetical protein Q8K99_07180 [Actinomycetota bacterium]|nr:hypothetical protein [Actinomycetota bacterium]